jgi:hypothetical protein
MIAGGRFHDLERRLRSLRKFLGTGADLTSVGVLGLPLDEDREAQRREPHEPRETKRLRRDGACTSLPNRVGKRRVVS